MAGATARGETIRRREFFALTGASVASPLAAQAQEPGRTYRLGTLSSLPLSDPALKRGIGVLLDELPHHGFIEGKNLVVDYRVTGQDNNLRSQYAAELVKAKVAGFVDSLARPNGNTTGDVIVVAGDPAIRAAQQATKTIPILASTDDMVGVSILATELDGKRQEVLIEAMPGLRRMAALADFNRAPVNLRLCRGRSRTQHRAFDHSSRQKRGHRSRY
jgi:putative ABC transport system substrate-binding protein